MPDAHIIVISAIPLELARFDPAVQTGEVAAPALPFARVLTDRLEALCRPATNPRCEEAPSDPGDANDEADERTQSEALSPLVLPASPALGDMARRLPQDLADSDGRLMPPLPGASVQQTATAAHRIAGPPRDLAIAAPAESALFHGSDTASPTPGDPAAITLAPPPDVTPSFAAPAPAPVAAPAPVPVPVPMPVVAVAAPVHTPEWRDAVGERVTVLVRERIQAAELHLHPPELGPVSVRIDVSGQDASVVFGVQHPETRNLLTEALPRLAELLAANGIVLADAQVGAEFPSQREANEDAEGRGAQAPRNEVTATSAVAVRGLVDVFA